MLRMPGAINAAHLRLCLYKHKGGSSSAKPVCLDRRAREAIFFWHRFIPKWDRSCPVFLDFGPVASAQIIWQFDASTDWGMGTFMWDTTSAEGYYILHEWDGAERDDAMAVERLSTTILEGMAAVRCACAFARRSRGKRVLLQGDNEALARGLRRCYSKHPKIMGFIHSVWAKASAHNICLRSTHIMGVCTDIYTCVCTCICSSSSPTRTPSPPLGIGSACIHPLYCVCRRYFQHHR